jgi:hypothetical protein
MEEDEYVATLGMILGFILFAIMIFLFARNSISSPTYNYTDYCIDNFGEDFVSSNSGDYGIKRCSKIEDGEIIEKFFKQFESHKTSECERIEFWNLKEWHFTYCNWNDVNAKEGVK